MARHPGIHSIERLSTVGALARTVIHESPQAVSRTLMTFAVPTCEPSQALGRTDVARRNVLAPSMEMSRQPAPAIARCNVVASCRRVGDGEDDVTTTDVVFTDFTDRITTPALARPTPAKLK